MVVPFQAWLAEAHGIAFDLTSGDWGQSMRRGPGGDLLAPAEIWGLLGAFFDSEMPRQYPISGAVAAITALQASADVVILTNLQDHRAATRGAQLASHGIVAPVFTNQGPKGPAIARIMAEHQADRAIFIDDLPQHHSSAAQDVPATTRLHFCGEPILAPIITCAHAAGDAHARIDRWDAALPWLQAQLEGYPA